MIKNRGVLLSKCINICASIGLVALFTGTATFAANAVDLTKLIGSCEDCHGKNGASQNSDITTIGGFSAVYTNDALSAYQDKARPCDDIKYPAGEHKGEVTTMCQAVEKLSPETIELIAEHFADKPFVRAKQTFDPGLAKKGRSVHRKSCEKCHEDGGSSADDDAGIMAGQWMPYLTDQFKEYASGERPMPKKMKPKMEKLSDEDIEALVHFYGSFE